MTETEKLFAKKTAEKALRASYEGKVCPFALAAGTKTVSPLLTNMGEIHAPESEVVGCQGAACMLFISTGADKAGNITGGACALAVLPSAILQCRDALVANFPKNSN